MMGPRWRKTLQDLLHNKSRTALAVLSIALGVFSIGTIAGSRSVLMAQMQAIYQRVNPPSGTLYTAPFGEDLLKSVRRMPAIRAADARQTLTVRVQATSGKWQDMIISAIPDFNDIRVSKVFPVAGAWPPGRNEIVLERSSLSKLNLQPEETVRVGMPGGLERELRVVGVAHEMNLPPPAFSETTYG